MMSEEQRLTPTNLLAAADRILEEGGYARVPEEMLGSWSSSGVRVYEDPYCVVAMMVYETWGNLVRSWGDAQASLVELMSRFWTRADAKAWDGYLVLLTPAGPDDPLEADTIRYNTSRVRKLLATGEELNLLSDVTRALVPLLPLAEIQIAEEETALGLLPRLLAQHDIEGEAVRVLIRAFEEQQPLVEKLHDYRGRS